MTTLTYTSLINLVMNYLKRNDEDTRSHVKVFISLAQDRIAKEANTIGLTRYITGTFEVGNWEYPKPANWLRPITANFGTLTNGASEPGNYRNSLELRLYDYLMMYWPDRSVLGVPKFYAEYGPYSWYVAPTPQLAFPFEMAYYEQPITLSDTTETNWLTNYAPRLLLYATFCEAMLYLDNLEKLQKWEDQYQSALAALNKEDMRRKIDKGADPGAD